MCSKDFLAVTVPVSPAMLRVSAPSLVRMNINAALPFRGNHLQVSQTDQLGTVILVFSDINQNTSLDPGLRKNLISTSFPFERSYSGLKHESKYVK